MEIMKEQYNKKQNALPIDRLSDLPDSILSHIFSFLPTASNSVATSVLSRRYMERNYHQIETWITFAVERNVQNIDIYLIVHLDSPRCLFTCKTLIDLRLDRCGVVPDRGSIVFLPHLKRLHLIHVKYEGDESLSHLILGCPVLEDLVLQLCIDYCSCKISSPTIKMCYELDVEDHCHFDKESENQDYNKVEINTPALVYLELLDYANQRIKCGALTSLIEADVEIDCSSINPDDSFLYSRSLIYHNVQRYGFHDPFSAHCIIDSVFTAWTTTTFGNLTKLELISDCCFLSKFLENADNLEILILQKVC
ncbi:hypothetical protein MIMGU_mgv1a025939mg [Erythranthe guttata]|uniref:F-box/LRR-repeat protein 15/At3g58940/PEG3-like LRR domain-containing protein n=1 Tax=Erythranthe guttata TaxID=4155 RepID=A0A022RM68_ERYGU|nr:hypothetical protein MIMGU_mgv1a025939mg [Erythranthe guttata]